MVMSVAPRRGNRADRWEEWVIRGSIILLLVVGIVAIWGEPIREWVHSLGGSAAAPDTSGGHAPRAPGGTL